MQFSRVNPQQLTLSLLQELSANGDRFRNKLAQRVASQATSIQADQQELFMPVGGNKDRRNPSAQTACGAVTVNLPLTGIHHSQVALAVYDLASDAHSSHVASCLLVRGRGIHHSDGAGCYFYHGPALTINQLTLYLDSFAFEASHEFVGPMFSRRDQQIARIFVLLPGLPCTRDYQRWEGPRHENAFKRSHLPEFKRGISKWLLSNDKNQSRGHHKQAKHNNDPSHKTSQCGGCLR